MLTFLHKTFSKRLSRYRPWRPLMDANKSAHIIKFWAREELVSYAPTNFTPGDCCTHFKGSERSSNLVEDVRIKFLHHLDHRLKELNVVFVVTLLHHKRNLILGWLTKVLYIGLSQLQSKLIHIMYQSTKNNFFIWNSDSAPPPLI